MNNVRAPIGKLEGVALRGVAIGRCHMKKRLDLEYHGLAVNCAGQQEHSTFGGSK